MPPKEDQDATQRQATPPPATLSPAFLKDVLQKSTIASNNATKAMQDTLAALPALLAQALTDSQAGAVAAVAAVAAAAKPERSRNLHDRKVPDFWETKPTSWFHVFESHLDPAANHTERTKFALLLPLLTTAAVNKVDRLVKAPPNDVYTVAKEKLLAHFERDPLDMAAELGSLHSLGDNNAVSFLEYMRSLQPGEAETTLFKHIFLRSLPSHVSSVVAHHATLDEMAKAADMVLKVVPGESQLSVNALSSEYPRDKLVDGLCAIHAKFGRDAYHCLLSSCKMKNVLKKKNTGNANAGRK